MSNSFHDPNPFSDSAALPGSDRDVLMDSVLHVGQDATLTLGADSLSVSDEASEQEIQSKCFGLIQKSVPLRQIPYFNILSAKIENDSLTIKFARSTSSKQNAPLVLRKISYSIAASLDQSQAWVDKLLDCAYGSAQRHKRIKVLINPYGGAGKAHTKYYKHIAPILEAAGCTLDVERTSHQGHAIEIAERLDINKFDVLASVSGDGLPMECFNGLARKPNAAEALRKIAVVQLPCGTGNAMSWNLNGTGECSLAALCLVKGIRSKLDLASVTQSDKRTLSFLSQSLGIVAESDLGTDNIRWMGDFRFTFGFLVRLLGKTVYPIEYAVRTEIEDKEAIKSHYAAQMTNRSRSVAGASTTDSSAQVNTGLPPLRFGTINDPLPKDENSGWTPMESYPNLGNFYCGNMCYMAADAPFFPSSLPNDGLLDLITIDGDISRLQAFKLMLHVEDGSLFDQEIVRMRKVSAIRVIPRFGAAAPKAAEAGDESVQMQKKGLFARLMLKMSGGPPGVFSVDGEALPFEPFQIEIHQGLGTTLSRHPGRYEYKGPNGWEELDQRVQGREGVSSST